MGSGSRLRNTAAVTESLWTSKPTQKLTDVGCENSISLSTDMHDPTVTQRVTAAFVVGDVPGQGHSGR